VQLSLFGEIDPAINFNFVPLYQMTPAEEADIRAKDGVTDVGYINAGVVDPSEVREKLAKDPTSGYDGLDVSKVIEPPAEPDDVPPDDGQEPPAQDADFEEGKHPRDEGGKFGSGGGGASESKGKTGAIKLKAGNVQLSEPLGFTKDLDFGDYSIDHPEFPEGQRVAGKSITIKNGKIVGMSPKLAERLGVSTVGEQAGPTASQESKAQKEAAQKAEGERQGALMGGIMGVAHRLGDGKLTAEEAKAEILKLKEKYGSPA